MEVIVSAAVSIDGSLDDGSPRRLRLSSDEDWEAVARLRASCDAILIGAGTLRADNPSLVIKDRALRKKRVEAGMPEELWKIVVSGSGNIPPGAKFFNSGCGPKTIITTRDSEPYIESRFKGTEIVALECITARNIVRKLEEMGCRKLMVEGGSQILSMFFREGVPDRFRMAVAPFFVGDSKAPRLICDGIYPWDGSSRMELLEVEKLGDTAVMHFQRPSLEKITKEDRELMKLAVEESRKCVPDDSNYSVGAVIRTVDGKIFTGYTHETGLRDHAEQAAVKKAVDARANLQGASVYSTMEPCSSRKSYPESCSEILIRHKVARIFYGINEPSVFVNCDGRELLTQAGIEVIRIPEFVSEIETLNSHITGYGK